MRITNSYDVVRRTIPGLPESSDRVGVRGIGPPMRDGTVDDSASPRSIAAPKSVR